MTLLQQVDHVEQGVTQYARSSLGAEDQVSAEIQRDVQVSV